MRFTRFQLLSILVAFVALGTGVLYRFTVDDPPIVVEESNEPEGIIPDYEYNPIQKIKDPEILEKIADSMKVNVNAASVEELQQLHRVGRKTAEAIISYRNENGPFSSLDDLTNIRGIGPKTVARFREHAICGPYEKTHMPSESTAETASGRETPSSAGKTDSRCTIGLININRATVEELVTLPRIGPSTAEKIITYREENGPFATVEDLTNVKGIGSKTLERLREYICAE